MNMKYKNRTLVSQVISLTHRGTPKFLFTQAAFQVNFFAALNRLMNRHYIQLLDYYMDDNEIILEILTPIQVNRQHIQYYLSNDLYKKGFRTSIARAIFHFDAA